MTPQLDRHSETDPKPQILSATFSIVKTTGQEVNLTLKEVNHQQVPPN